MRERIQAEALKAWQKTGRGILAMCTGSGKSKIAIDAIRNYKQVLIVVPTEKLRDMTWPNEFQKWNEDYKKVDLVCYASLHKLKKGSYSLVVLDEGHHITEKNFNFFLENEVKDIMVLTASPPKDEIKQVLLDKLNCPIVYEYTLDQGVSDKVVAPYEIKVVQLLLDRKDKYIKAGNKKKQFLTTEEAYYKYLTKLINVRLFNNQEVPKFFYLNRMRFIYNLKSKTLAAKHILSKINTNERTLIFCGSKKQADELCKNRYYSGRSDKDLNAFIKGKINRLSCVQALNEGHNLPLLDSAVVVQLNSNEKDLIQRIGRIVRYRDGHRATIWILSVLNTQDEKWTKEALKTFDNVTYEFFRGF